MDRGQLNLEALTEEDDEESWERSDESSGEDGDEGMRGGEPNQFDNLCDGVLSCMALVHASLGELLELKDELLRHSLPPSVLTRSVLVTSKVFRSFSDMHVPVGELIRMVRLYSTPWEEKSTALKKLHDDYEGKKTQLNIAIKRLEFIDAHSKRIARERRIMNWEKLFAKLTAAKGHGRRWKFLIDAFKQRANLGMEKLQEYLDSMDASASEDEEEEEEEETEVATQMQHVGMGSPSLNQEGDEDEASSESESSSDDDEDASKDMKESEVTSEVDSGPQQKPEEEVRKQVVIKPPVKDAEVWAGEPEFDRELHIRVFEPEGLDCRELRCILSLGDAMRKTDILDMNHREETVKPAPPKEEAKPPTTPKRGGRGRGMIGGRGSRVSPSMTPTLQMAPLPENEEDTTADTEKIPEKFYEECVFDLPEEPPEGQLILGGETKVIPSEHLRVAVHFGPREEIVAMATIHMSDLQDLELPTIALGPPVGDEFDVEKALEEERLRQEKVARVVTPEKAISEVERANTELSETPPAGDGEAEDADSPEDAEIKDDVKEEEEEQLKAKPKLKPFNEETEKFVNEQLGERKAFSFPLYSIHSGKSDTVHVPCGKLPLLCFWVKKERPRQLSKMTESESVNALVLDMTGIDLSVTTKEDLNKETRDEALSIISFTPEPTEETVARAEYDRLMSAHNEEMEMLQNEYEQRLQELMDTIQQLQEAQMEMSAMAAMPQAMVAAPTPPRTLSRSPARSHTSPHVAIPQYESPFQEVYTRHSSAGMPRPPSNKHTETEPPLFTQVPRPQPRLGKPNPKWGKNLSTDFFERLQQFEELAAQRRAELREHILAGMRTDIEKKMASQYRLAQQNEEGLFDAIQDVSLPAVFLPSKSKNLQIFNPRAHKYFHPTGTGGARLAQPPSMLQLPPLPKSKMSVLNLFDVSQNFHRGGPDWLMQRYLSNADASTQEQMMPHQEAPPASATAPTVTNGPSVHLETQESQGIQPVQQQQPDSPVKSPVKSAAKSRQSGSGGSNKSRVSSSARHQQAASVYANASTRHQVTIAGNTSSMGHSPPQKRPASHTSPAGSAGGRHSGAASAGGRHSGAESAGVQQARPAEIAGGRHSGAGAAGGQQGVPAEIAGGRHSGAVSEGEQQSGAGSAARQQAGPTDLAGGRQSGAGLAGGQQSEAGSAGSRQSGAEMAGGQQAEAGSVAGSRAASVPMNGGRTPTQSVSPADYVPPGSAATLSATPAMLKSPFPVGVQEEGLAAPPLVPSLRLLESETPT